MWLCEHRALLNNTDGNKYNYINKLEEAKKKIIIYMDRSHIRSKDVNKKAK